MKLKWKPTPEWGASRWVKRFAWLPIEVKRTETEDVWIWWEHYYQREGYDQYGWHPHEAWTELP